MPKQIPATELDAIVQVVGQFPNGAAVSEVRGVLDIELSRRTLQRRLARLVEGGRLETFGEGRAQRYRVTGSPVPDEASPPATKEIGDDVVGPPSADAGDIQPWGEQPIQSRQTVVCSPDLLAAYQPNRTFYLDEATRCRLRELGQSPEGFQSAGTHAKEPYPRWIVDLTWNSSRLEGTTYSLLETWQFLHTGQPAEGKDAGATQMLLNHKAAIALLVSMDLVNAPDGMAFTHSTVCKLQALLSENLFPDSSTAWQSRVPDGIFHSLLHKANAIADPFEQALFVLVHVPRLQPFADVNTRVSRLAANMPFLRMNLVPLSFVDVPRNLYASGLLSVYELNRPDLLRDLFIWAYEHSCRRYSTARRLPGAPDLFRMQYREPIRKLVSNVVHARMNKGRAASRIKAFALGWVPVDDQQRFIEVVETELLNLHEGNVARYRVRPTAFRNWQQRWQPVDFINFP